MPEIESYFVPKNEDEQAFQIVFVHRYDNPDRFGIHRMWGRDPYPQPRPHDRIKSRHMTLGLFSAKEFGEFRSNLVSLDFVEHKFADLTEQEQYDIIHTSCPIEWHSIMDQPEMMDRVLVYKWERA